MNEKRTDGRRGRRQAKAKEALFHQCMIEREKLERRQSGLSSTTWVKQRQALANILAKKLERLTYFQISLVDGHWSI